MSAKPEKDALNVVDLSSSDEDERIHLQTHQQQQQQQQQKSSHTKSPMLFPWTESLSFWKAGDYDPISTPSPSFQEQLERARVHPKFLHTNATSHKWAFGAIAELLDNAVDEICHGATFVKVDKIYNTRNNSPALLFQDNGGGMDPDCMRQCMSLGYSSKKTNTTIGQYGNGFKTSTMRLGADAIVFSRKICGSQATQSIGLLSYTFLRRTGQDDIIVPMVDFEINDNRAQPIIYSSQDDWSNNLQTIIDWSPFSSTEELLLQFEDIRPHGTKVIVYNLWLNDDGDLELDFDDNEEDIRLRDENNFESLPKSLAAVQSHISYCLRYSLRAYASVLYLKKFAKFQIILRGKPIQQLNIAKELNFPKEITYRPQLGIASKEVLVEATIGFVREAPNLRVHGFNIYHKNRLIMPFFKVLPGGGSLGNGVVGVLEANFIEPAHDKQDFERTALFIRLETRLKQMINEYWKSHCHLIGYPSYPLSRADMHGTLKRGLPVEQPIIGLAANCQTELSTNPQHIIGIAAPRGINSSDTTKEVTSMDDSGSDLVDKICEENIQLFMRCEEHRQKEAELKQTVEKMEGELKEAIRKCSQLATNIEIQRKQIKQ
ncbi:protein MICRORCHIDIA 2-like [Tasmannia lanceolata]|uniref:protein MICRORCHIDIA 2-like n=1 Tax=Tasmannia lanceolata TaxID=3420 RepID=UPI0040648FCD